MNWTVMFESFVMAWISTFGYLAIAEENSKVFLITTDGRTPYSTIQAAIDAAPKGAVVQIGPGTFEEPVLINKPLTMEGAGADRTFLSAPWVGLRELIDGKGIPEDRQPLFDKLKKIAVEVEHGEGPATASLWETFGPKPALAVKNTKDVVLRGLSVSMPGEVQAGGGQVFHMVFFENAALIAEDCAFVGSAVDGVEIAGTSNIAIRKCLIGGIWNSGVTVNAPSPSKIEIADCDIRGCGYAGISIKGTGDVTVSRCRISGIAFHGIRYDDTSPTITGNVFSDIKRSGIYVDGKTKGRISENLFFDCAIGGDEDNIFNNTFVHKTDHSLTSSNSFAIGIRGSGQASIRQNIISGYDHALYLYTTDQASLNRESTHFERNLCDTTKSVIANAHRLQARTKETAGELEIHDLPLPDENWRIKVKFTDPERGDYSLSSQVKWPDLKCGSTTHTAVLSPWAEQKSERAMLDQIKEAKSQAP